MRFVLKALLALALLAALLLGGLRLAAHLRETEGAEALPPEMRILRHPEGDIAMLEVATDPAPGGTVLLIHGSVGYSLTWLETAEALSEAGYHPFAIDLPPMGFSQREPDGDFGRAATAARILRTVEQLRIRPHLVAHSFGAGAAVEAVMQSPDSFASLTIVSGALPLDPPADATLPAILRPLWLREVLSSATVTNPLVARPLLQQFLYRDEAATDAVLSTLSRPARQTGATEAVAAFVPHLLIVDADLPSAQSEAYRGITLPVALIWGAEDTTTPLSDAERLRDLIPGATLTVLPGVGHIPMIEDAPAFDAALIAALAVHR